MNAFADALLDEASIGDEFVFVGVRALSWTERMALWARGLRVSRVAAPDFDRSIAWWQAWMGVGCKCPRCGAQA